MANLIKEYRVKHTHQDPVRYPAVIDPYENEFKLNYRKALTNTLVQFTKQIVEDTKYNSNAII